MSETGLAGLDAALETLRRGPKTWVVTGVSGFIGSHLLEALLLADQNVVGLDNFLTGKRSNLIECSQNVGPERWRRFRMLEGDIRDAALCAHACQGADFVLHQAAVGSVPKSIENPELYHDTNVTGFFNILIAARNARVKRFVFASSSAVYGDERTLPKVENRIGKCLSPYAATKRMNELYAEAFSNCYGLETIGLRYFNVFGSRQNPKGLYAAVIPLWIASMVANQPVQINGDGETSRDFCYVRDVVQANILAASSQQPDAPNRVYNVAYQTRTSLNQLFQMLKTRLEPQFSHLHDFSPDPSRFPSRRYQAFRGGHNRSENAPGLSPPIFSGKRPG